MNQQTPVQMDSGLVFSGTATNNFVQGWDKPTAATPKINANYVYPEWASNIVVWLLHVDEPLYLFGPTGCGKTSCVKQLVARLNYSVYEVTGHSRLEFPEMVGHHTVQDGNMKYVYGPLALAMKYGGLFLLNEVDLLDPSTAAGLNSVLDGSPLTIPENNGEIIEPHPMFKFVATANSNGGSDHTGLYQGVLRQNLAFMDRFMVVEADYLDAEVEKAILERAHPSLDKNSIEKMVKMAGTVRQLFMGEAAEGSDAQIEVTMSTRTLLRWAHLTLKFEGLRNRNVNVVEYALDRALGFRATPATRQTLKDLLQRIWG